MCAALFRLLDFILLGLAETELKILFIISARGLCRCLFFFRLRLCRCSCCAILRRDEIIQFLDDQFVVLCSLIRTCLYVVEIALDRIQALEQKVNHRTGHFDFLTADLLEHILHVMCQALHSLKAHGSSHSL